MRYIERHPPHLPTLQPATRKACTAMHAEPRDLRMLAFRCFTIDVQDLGLFGCSQVDMFVATCRKFQCVEIRRQGQPQDGARADSCIACAHEAMARRHMSKTRAPRPIQNPPYIAYLHIRRVDMGWIVWRNKYVEGEGNRRSYADKYQHITQLFRILRNME